MYKLGTKSQQFPPGIIFLRIHLKVMKKYILPFLLSSVILSVSCNNPNHTTNKNADTTVSGNTDSSGSQPVQPGPGSANGGNATDTIAREHEQPPRTDSVIRH